MGPFVRGDKTEIIGIWKSDELLLFKTITILLLVLLQSLQDGVKDHEEDDGSQRITLKNSASEI